jgi:sigma-B regulation protein RsbU (phosphoserine phosphatase)
MENTAKLVSALLPGEADALPVSPLLSQPELAATLSLLYEVSRELTSILDREVLLQGIAERVKRLVNYHVFTVMLWNEKTQLLESVFAMRYQDSIPARYTMRLHQGISGTAAGERRTLRVNDVREDPRYIQCELEFEVRSELVVPLIDGERLIGVFDLDSPLPDRFNAADQAGIEAAVRLLVNACRSSG